MSLRNNLSYTKYICMYQIYINVNYSYKQTKSVIYIIIELLHMRKPADICELIYTYDQFVLYYVCIEWIIYQAYKYM